MISRRNALAGALVGSGYVALRTLATGLPASLLLNPRRALADPQACAHDLRPQFFIISTSGQGDPINANVPGTYDDPAIVHSADPAMAPVDISLAGRTVRAATPWSTLPQAVLDRTTFWHLMTTTPVHPKEPDVLKLMNATAQDEMLPSILCQELAACLGTIQAQPICLGATSPSESITFNGQALPILPPLALKATLTNAPGPLTNLQAKRDESLAKLYDVYRNGATSAQRAYIDSLVTSQAQVRNIRQDLLGQLESIKDNGIEAQITAAITLIQMNVTPVLTIHIPFGGDNHHDVGLATETAQTASGVSAIARLMQALASAGLSDRVTFATLNVFGRTLGPSSADGRQHNENHQVSLTIGKPFRGGVIGGVRPVANDYGATAIDSASGAASDSGDVPAAQSLASFGQTLLASVGLDPATIGKRITSGKVIRAALTS